MSSTITIIIISIIVLVAAIGTYKIIKTSRQGIDDDDEYMKINENENIVDYKEIMAKNDDIDNHE